MELFLGCDLVRRICTYTPELFKFDNLVLKLFFLGNQPLDFIIFDNSVIIIIIVLKFVKI